MRRRAIEMTTAAVAVAVAVLGVPLGGAWIVLALRMTPPDAEDRVRVVLTVLGSVLGLAVVAVFAAMVVALRVSRRLSAPLIYLAAEAEQLGSGQVRPRLRASGIEEIDLVQAELVRSAERMAGRLAAERQFASDASHQLRTPLTSLSLRLEEIELLSSEEEVRTEAHACLEQVERLTGVVEELLRMSRRSGGGTTEALHLADVFDQQREEWEPAFTEAGRRLTFADEVELPVLATPGSLAQVLATSSRTLCATGPAPRACRCAAPTAGTACSSTWRTRAPACPTRSPRTSSSGTSPGTAPREWAWPWPRTSWRRTAAVSSCANGAHRCSRCCSTPCPAPWILTTSCPRARSSPSGVVVADSEPPPRPAPGAGGAARRLRQEVRG